MIQIIELHPHPLPQAINAVDNLFCLSSKSFCTKAIDACSINTSSGT